MKINATLAIAKIAVLTAAVGALATANPTTAPASATTHHVQIGHAAQATAPVVSPWFTKRKCREEDSVNCAWNAGEQGNHHGHSFVVREFPGSAHMVCVMYANRKFARHHDYCEATR